MLKTFLKDENGQTTVEYLLIIAVIVVAISVLGKGLRDRLPETINKIFAGVNAKIDQLMKAAQSN